MRAEDIFAQVKNKRINLSSIYRSLHLLVAFGIAKKVNFHEDFTRYELSDQYRNHHHHLVCHACGKIEDYPDCDLETILQRVREEYGFETTAHDLELYGLCKGCQEEERK
jgi:Fur family ferric uptake transcriptional regulator